MHCRLSECLRSQGPAAYEEAARRIQHAQQQQQQPSGMLQSAGSMGGKLKQLQAALQRFILLQWLWFERQCSVYAQKASAGL